MTRLSDQEQTILETIRSLPPERVGEVRDFVDFLRSREGVRQLRQTWRNAGEKALSRVWDNAEDAAYDEL